MKPDELPVRLRHMLDAARKIQALSAKRTREDFDTDELFAFGMIHLVQIIGEAAKKVPKEFRAKHPEIPWKDIVGARDRLVHGYFDVDFGILWNIVSSDTQKLISLLEAILREL